jgi:photosystem II stability/assembly factor-like uncharacterized protein
MKPNEWFYLQRAFPNSHYDPTAYHEAQARARQLRVFTKPGVAGRWEPSGPVNVGGRITSLAVPKSSRSTIYIGSAAGGVFKTMDDGASWEAIFDDQPSLTIGDLAVDPRDTNIVYVGTGEANGMRVSFPGAGVFKSTDGGERWRPLGLEKTYAIGRVAIDPHNSSRIFVAATGNPFHPDQQRGLFRSTDGGASWQRVLFGNDTTGGIDVAIDPVTPNVVYAALWQRWGDAMTSSYGGSGSGLFKSTDGGTTWRELRGGLPDSRRGRIGIAIAPSEPSIIYAIYSDSSGYFQGLFRSDDAGTTWPQLFDGPLNTDFWNWYGWWFGQIRVHPTDPEKIFAFGIPMASSTDGGENWSMEFDAFHADQHALFIDPADPDRMILGNDGGLYISDNSGASWRHMENLPISQFYTCEIDYREPHRLYGGTQDNGTLRTMSGAIDDWRRILGGDGFYVLVDPTDNRYVYAESQHGGHHRSTDGGATMFMMTTGASGERFNWSTPMVLDPSNPRVIYTASDKIYRSSNRGVGWNAISDDLTKGGVGIGNPYYGTVTTIAVAPTDSRVIYAGTDDGNVWVTQDGGTQWTLVSSNLPHRWVTRVAVDPKDPRTAYVTYSGYRSPGGGAFSHIFRTTNAGAGWTDIGGNLPDAPVNDLIIDPENPSLLYAGTDVGVFYTTNPEQGWLIVGDGLPQVAVMDLVLHKPTDRLVAATYGRSMYSIDVGAILGTPDDGSNDMAMTIKVHPDPFVTTTTINIDLASRQKEGRIEIFDLSGRHVRTLFSGTIARGENRYIWDGRDDRGRMLPAGVYYCRASAGAEGVTARVGLVK